MTVKHIEHDFTIQIASKRGKPVVNKQGFVNITKGVFKQCHTITMEVLEEKFEVVA